MARLQLPIFQYAYFVEDLESAAEQWADTVGAGPFFITPHHRADRFDYRGTSVEADVSYAFGYAGDSQIQLIQQHDDRPSIYLDMYPEGFGFHHIASLVRDYEVAKAHVAQRGEVVCELHANDIVACYIDTRPSTGCFTELHSYTERIANTFARWKAAHDTWDGNGSALRSHVSGT